MKEFIDMVFWLMFAGFFVGIGIWSAEAFLSWYGEKLSILWKEIKGNWKIAKEQQRIRTQIIERSRRGK